MGSNMEIERYLSSSSPYSFAFFDYNLGALPAWPFIVACFFKVFGVSLFAAKFASLLFSVLLIVIVFFLANEIFENSIIPYQIAILLSLDYQLFWLGTMARPDMAAAVFAFAGVYFLVKYVKTDRMLYGIFMAFLFFIALLTHGISIVIVLSCGIVEIVRNIRTKVWRRRMQAVMIIKFYSIPVIVFVGFSLAWYWFQKESIHAFLSYGGQNFNLFEAFAEEFNKKIFDSYNRRYLLLYLASIALFACQLIKKLWQVGNNRVAVILIMTALIFIFGIFFDTYHTKSHLIYYIPFFCSIFVLGVRDCLSSINSINLKYIIILFFIANLLMPKLGESTGGAVREEDGEVITRGGPQKERCRSELPPRLRAEHQLYGLL